MRNIIKSILYYFLNAINKKDKVILSGFSRGIKNVEFEGKNAVPDACNFSGRIIIGFATTLGYRNVISGDVTIGKYCQIGFDVALHATNHPITFMSIYINKNLFNGELKSLRENNKIVLGNDVLVGHGVIIVGNVTVGNGAIIAAGSVVTKDVKPYSIVGGVPAKEIKMRFSDTIIKEIEELKWWNMSESELEKIKPLFFKDFTNSNSIYE